MILPGQGITSESAPAPNGTTFLVPDFATGPQNQEAARKDSTDPDKGSMQGLDDLKEGTTLHGRARWFAPSPGGHATGPTTWQTEWETTVTDAVPLVLADHHVVFAEGLRMILDAEDDLAVLDVAHHTCRAVELVTEHRPAVLSLDAHLPTGDLVATLAAVKAASPTTKALVLSGDAHPETTAVVMASGADGFLAKASSSRQLASVIRKLAAGEQATVMGPSRHPSVELRVRTLSCRERELLGLLANGWSSRRIAKHWRVSYLTVRSHVQHLLVKLGVHSQLEAVAFAIEHQVVVVAGGWRTWDHHT